MEFTAKPITSTSSIHGEGALWDARTQKLLWVDIDGRRVKRHDPVTGKNEEWDTKSPCGTVVKRAKGADQVAVALGDGIAILDLTNGAIEYLVKVDLGKERFNDGKCDRAGRFWAGSMQAKETAKLWRLDADHSLHEMLAGVTISNGIVWTRDKKIMYYIDSATGMVEAFDYDNASGAISNRRCVVDVRPMKIGGPDGMAIDENDLVWVALWGGSRVCCFDPKTGALLHTVHCPGSLNTSSCAFGGKNLDELFVTTSTQGMSPEKKAQFTNSGQLFHVKLPFRGVVADEYAG
jgi:sugar lactone lactonase YvrE